MARSKMFKESPVRPTTLIIDILHNRDICSQVSLRPKEELDHIQELYKDYDKRYFLKHGITNVNYSFTQIGWQPCAIFCTKMTSRPATQGLRHNLRLRRRRKSISNLSRWPCQRKIDAHLENMVDVH